MARHNPYMDEPQDFASMDVSDDYNDVVEGEDGEFYTSGKVTKKAQTKEQQLYGIWADDDEWDGEDGRHNKKYKQDRDKSARIARPMSFISSGVIAPGQDEKKSDDQDMKQAEEPMEEDESSKNARLAKERLQARSKHRKKQEKADTTTSHTNKSAPSASFVPPKLDKDFGAFNQHTTGFGLKMLQKYGFAGRLGKNEQGIANPIVAKVRPKGMGFGFNDFKETHGEEFARNAIEEEQARKEKEAKQAKETKTPDTTATQWKKSKKESKPKPVYKTVDQVLAEQAATEAPQVVLDMRGPHVKVTSLDKITSTPASTGWTPTAAQSSLPELQHNVKLLVELTETDIHRLHREYKHAQDTMTNLENERDELESQVIQEEQSIQRTEQCLAVCEQLQQQLKSIASMGNSLSARFDAIAAFIDTIHHHYIHETRIYHLSTYAFTLVTPLFKALFHTWEPLQPTHGTTTEQVLEILTRWKMLLSGEGGFSSRTSSSDDLYSRILYELLLPKLQLCISTQWIPRESSQSQYLTHLLSSLHPILPSDMYHTLIATLILPKLKLAIDIWNPRTDGIPIHSWVEPWCHVIPDEPMRPMHHMIRQKLSIALQAWHTSDTSALTVISPWIRIWSTHDTETFLLRSIIPKLTTMLSTELTINPQSQRVQPFTTLMAWQPVIPARIMVQILYEHFFPKWLTALTTWLSSDPDFEEVSKWYLGWKHLFPESLRELPAIKLIFNKSLDLMNHAVQGLPLESMMQSIHGILQNELQGARRMGMGMGMGVTSPHIPTGPSPSELTRQMEQERVRRNQQQQQQREVDESSITLKDVMSQYATLNHLEFVPNLKRGLYDGKQIYLFGQVSVYTSGKDIYAYQPTTSSWQPISLPELLTRAQNLAATGK